MLNSTTSLKEKIHITRAAFNATYFIWTIEYLLLLQPPELCQN